MTFAWLLLVFPVCAKLFNESTFSELQIFWMVGWLVGWLAGWLVGWPAGWLAGVGWGWVGRQEGGQYELKRV